ncbi:MAG TPA: hypothetical protein VI653_05900 [Steroidobacteraceae bacterium]
MATQHGSLQNADTVITHLTALLSGFTLALGAFKKATVQVALEVEDLFFASEPIAIRARPNDSRVALSAYLWDRERNHPLASTPMSPGPEGWREAVFASPGPGVYRVTVGGADVEPAEDAFLVV